MKKSKTIRQFLDIFLKIAISFIVVFVFFYLTKFINSFAYNYFIFPFVSIIVIFICGVKVGRSLEKIKNNESTGIFTLTKNDGQFDNTEFTVKEIEVVNKDKKIIKQEDNEEKVHVKTFDIDEELEKIFQKENR